MTKILIIEDAEDLRNDVLEMLSLEGFEAFGADNGRTGLDTARQHHPDMIVCDIMMPELSGYQVLQELRKDPETATIPFIFLTAKTERDDMRYGMVLGADDYLTKPFLISELLDSIRARLDKRDRLQKQAEQRLNELRDSITTALPHELRTPLNTIMGFSEMLISEAQYLKPDQVADWAQHINSASQRLFGLIENYLLYVRVETTANQPDKIAQLRNMQTIDPRGPVEMRALLKAQQADREEDLELAFDETGMVPVTDEDLGRLTGILVENAFKFSQPGTPVHVSLSANDSRVHLTISDQGSGMSEDQVQNIGAYVQFNRDFQEQQGAGLGLAIARRLAQIYACDLAIDSAIDKGTTISVGLPLAEE